MKQKKEVKIEILRKGYYSFFSKHNLNITRLVPISELIRTYPLINVQ